MRTLKTLLLRYGVAVLAPVFVCLAIWAIRLLLAPISLARSQSHLSFWPLCLAPGLGYGPVCWQPACRCSPCITTLFLSIPWTHSGKLSRLWPSFCWRPFSSASSMRVAGRRKWLCGSRKRKCSPPGPFSSVYLPVAFPQSPEFDIAGICHPVDPTGGDYFDFIPMQHGQIGIVVADVSGHGIASALIMVQVRAYLRALVRTHGQRQRDPDVDQRHAGGRYGRLFFRHAVLCLPRSAKSVAGLCRSRT